MTTEGEDVVDNAYASINMGHDDDFETANPKDVELKEVNKGGDSNGFHSNPSAAKNAPNGTSKAAETGRQSSPFLPKIFIALLIVCLIAVIALCFVLYNLDKQVTKANDENSKLHGEMKSLRAGKSEMEKTLKQFQTQIGSINKVLTRIDKVNGSTVDLNKALLVLQAWRIDAVEELKAKDDSIGKLRDLIISEGVGITKENRTLQDIAVIVNTNKDAIDAKSKLITKLQEEEKQSDEKIKEVDGYADQLKMRIQYDEAMKTKIQLDFKQIMELAGMKDKVSGTDPTLQKLLNQKTSFDKTYKNKWGIGYNDILRLTSVDDFKEKEIPVLAKIETMYKLFIGQYNTNWKIEFKNVIKFTVKSDLTNMALADKEYLFNEVPKVLLKIDYLFKTFTEKYKPKWHIAFKDLISVTEKLVEVHATDIPVIKKIDGWFVDNFNEIWGSSFEGLFHELIKSDEEEREIIVGKLKKIAEKNTLNFLPATFKTNDKVMTISGFVKILIGEAWGTIYKGENMANTVKTVCLHGGYSKDGEILKDPPAGSLDRTNMTQLLRSARCYGDETNITLCKELDLVNKNDTTWPHTDDVAVKCFL